MPIRLCSLLVALASVLTGSSSFTAGIGADPTKPDLRGKVTRADGAPLPGARVVLYTAAVKTGTSPLCPSCYADCTKHADSGADGGFRIESLDPQLRFRVLVVADGYKPLFVEKVDPAAGPLAAKDYTQPIYLDAGRRVEG